MDTQFFPNTQMPPLQPPLDKGSQNLHIPTLKSVLDEVSPLPENAVVVGACEDGLPVLMDIGKPSGGSILIVAGPCAGKTELLLSILNSACSTNPARKLRISCISTFPEQFEKLNGYPHLYRHSEQEFRTHAETIDEFTVLVRKRQSLHDEGPAVLLGIDDLPEVVAELDRAQLEDLSWLIKNGPAVRVRVIATTDGEKLNQLGNMADHFGTLFVGKIDGNKVGTNLAQVPLETARAIKPGVQFCAQFDNEWVPFWILV